MKQFLGAMVVMMAALTVLSGAASVAPSTLASDLANDFARSLMTITHLVMTRVG